MADVDVPALEAALRTEPDVAPFDPTEVDELPLAAARYLRHAIAPGTPVWRSARLPMHGAVRLGRFWIPFRAHEVLAPRRGFVWSGRAAAGLLSGSDHLVGGEGAIAWKLLGVVPVASASGPDVARSGAGRAGGEAVWLPTQLLPRHGVEWREVDDHHAEVSTSCDGVEVVLRLAIDDDGALRWVRFDRWGDPDATGSAELHPFGLDVTGTQTFGGLTIPWAGVAGWHHGTDRWEDGRFFRYRITAVEPLTG